MSNLQLSNEVLARRVWNQPIYDQHAQTFMLGQTPQFIDKEKNVIDVGAAVGMYSHFFAQHCKKVFSFEAVHPVYLQLLKTAQKTPNIEPINKAVGKINGKASFFVDDKRLSNSSFHDIVGGVQIEVDVIRLDSMDFGEVGFIKLDTEGHELDALIGASNLIETQRPNVMCEIYPKFNNGPVDATFQYFFDRVYTCYYNAKGIGLIPIDSVKEGVQVASSEILQKEHDGDFLFVA